MSKDNWGVVFMLGVIAGLLYVACDKLDLILYVLENAQ